MTMVDIEELIDNVLAWQHPKMRERCFIDRIKAVGGCMSMSAQKFCAPAARLIFLCLSDRLPRFLTWHKESGPNSPANS
jgi:hypothetical protein